MNTAQRDLLALLELPYEKVNHPRGNGSIAFNLVNEPAVETRLGESPPTTVIEVPMRPDATTTNLGTATSIPRGSYFSHFLDSHRKAAQDLCDAFMKTQGPKDLMEFAARVKGMVNENLFVYALSFTILRRKDLRNIRLPVILEVFPHKFVPQEELLKTQAVANRMGASEQAPLVIEHGPDFSSTNVKPEHRVSYWREDYGLNSHHWHWHLVYPIGFGELRDRKGELFFYMHQQMLARYDMERLSVGIPRVEMLDNWRLPVPDGYFSKLTINNTGRTWGSRQDDTLMRDMRRTDIGFIMDISELEAWRSQLHNAIKQMALTDRNNEVVKLSDDVTTGKRGIELLGDAIEADGRDSVNPRLYGNIHNLGHVFISFVHDYNNAHKEEAGVMADTATAMRDPIFYRWHKFIDDLFQRYKMSLLPYTMEDLSLRDVVLERVKVVMGEETNALTTGFSLTEFETSRGLDFNSRVPILLRLTHMDYSPYEYHLQVKNNHPATKQVTVRIFLAPKHNEQGHEMDYAEQRLLWTEMDKFTVTLQTGSNHVVRSSKDSSVTNPNEYTFRDLETRPDFGTEGADTFDFCGCGWPQHLLLPRGKPEGMAFQLFYMLTDYEKDKVEQPAGDRTCSNAVSFCGIMDSKYPDSRPMGFPFDRNAPHLFNENVKSAVDLAKLNNIMVQDITITFKNRNMPQ